MAAVCFHPAQVKAGVVSDVLGLDGMTGKVADDVFDGGCKLIGGPVYNLGKGIYDTLSGTVGMLAGDHSTVSQVAGWADVVLNAAQTGIVIYTLATGTVMGTSVFLRSSWQTIKLWYSCTPSRSL